VRGEEGGDAEGEEGGRAVIELDEPPSPPVAVRVSVARRWAARALAAVSIVATLAWGAVVVFRCCVIVYHAFGLLLTILGIVIFPGLMALTPWYALAHGQGWSLVLFTYVTPFVIGVPLVVAALLDPDLF
jgi:hypothetical protein